MGGRYAHLVAWSEGITLGIFQDFHSVQTSVSLHLLLHKRLSHKCQRSNQEGTFISAKTVPQAQQGAKCPYSLDLLCLALQYHFTKSSKSHLHSCGAKPQLGEELANILQSLATRCCLVRAHLGSQVATSMAGRDSTSTMRCPGLGKARLHPGACSTAIWNKIMTSID